MLKEWNNKVFQVLLSRKREQIGRDAKFTIHLEITGGILGAVMEGGKREREEN